MGDSNADLNLSGTPSLVSRNGYKLVLGTAGDNDVIFVRNNVEVASITSTGFVISDFKLNNDTYLQSKNAAGTGELDLLKADTTDNTVLNAGTGKSIKLSIAGTAEVTVSDDLLAFSGTTATVQSAGSLVLKASADSQRVLTFSGSSDTALSLTFGDATASQVLTLGSLTANGSDNATVHLTAATNSAARSPFISIFGNQVTSDGGKLLLSTGSEGDDGRMLLITASTNPMQFYTNSLLRWSINGLTGDLTQDATNGGNIILSKADASIRRADDTDRVLIWGGTGSGAFLQLGGNSGGYAGNAYLSGGNQATSHVHFALGHASALFKFIDASAANLITISNAGSIALDRTNTAGGTTGAQTINKMAGSVNFAVAAASLVVTNSLVSETSNVIAVAQTNDATGYVKNVVPGSGSFTINLVAAATAETRVAFWVFN